MTTPARELLKRESLTRKAWQWLIAQYRQRPLLSGFITLLLITVLLAAASTYFRPRERGRGANRGGSREERGSAGLRFTIETLRRFDDYDHWRYTEMLRDSLSQWLAHNSPAGRWLPDPFLKEVPAEALQGLGYDSAAEQQLKTFTSEDARIIQGAAWMRDISNGVRSQLAAERREGVIPSLDIAAGLFDWTMRHVALDEEDVPAPELAWETLLWGRGKWQSRAWVFMELCRQQGLETGVLAYRDPEKPGAKEKPNYRLWLVAVLLTRQDGDQKEANDIYLFDPKLSLPLPGPGGKGIATLTQAIEQPETLKQLDTGVRSYPVKPADLKEMVVLLDPSPHLVSRRMQMLESELRGQDKLVLTSNLSRLADRFRRAKHVTAVKPWPWAYESLGMARAQENNPMYVQRLLPFMTVGFGEKLRRNVKLEEEHVDRFLRPPLLATKIEAATPEKVVSGPSRTVRSPSTYEGEIVNISESDMLVNVKDEQRQFLVHRNTAITLDGAKTAMADLKPGQHVKVTAIRQQPVELATETRREAEVASFLWKGRMLQFKGVFEDPSPEGTMRKQGREEVAEHKQGSPNVFQSGRLSDRQIDAMRDERMADLKKLPEAAQDAINKGEREELVIQRMQMKAAELQQQLAAFPFERLGRQLARALASNWIAQVAYERGDYTEAVEYFTHFREKELPILKEKELKLLAELDPQQLPPEARAQFEEQKRQLQSQYQEYRKFMVDPWLPIWDNAARDGLARAMEAAGRLEEAIDLYEADTSPDQRLGSLIRAKRLREKLAKSGERRAKSP
jgi:tetratricopeptide (TPR) repeat protein